MELIRISDSKLKIMLTPTDMCHYEINDEDFQDGEIHQSPAFRLLLEEVKRQVGFSPEDDHYTLRYFPSKRGGCEMFLTQLSPVSQENTHKKDPSAPALPVHCSRGSQYAFSGDYAYRLEDLEALLRGCRRLFGSRYITESTAYRDEKGLYYLILSVTSPSPFSLPGELQFLSEYGQTENPSLLRIYIKEHGRVICPKNAVAVLGELG